MKMYLVGWIFGKHLITGEDVKTYLRGITDEYGELAVKLGNKEQAVIFPDRETAFEAADALGKKGFVEEVNVTWQA